MPSLNLFQVSHLSRSLVKESGDQLRLEWKLAKSETQKDVRDLATQYDRIIENRITSQLSDLFPDHSIFGEEFTKDKKDSPYAWYLDPIDGTKYFASDVPLFTVSLGLTYHGQPIMGVVYNPISEQLYSGFNNGPAQVNYEEIKVAPKRPLKESLIYADLSKYETLSQSTRDHIKDHYFSVISHTYRVRAFGCGSLGLCWIASGAFDAFIDFTGHTKQVDVCAGLAILEAAGGTHQYIQVNGIQLLLAASNPDTLAEIHSILKTT
jgi:myo-inositol-1(or 4)-monophosphatase